MPGKKGITVEQTMYYILYWYTCVMCVRRFRGIVYHARARPVAEAQEEESF